VLPVAASAVNPKLTEAPAGFDGKTNGLVPQAEMDAAREIFDEAEELDEGLGPVYNARSCGGCHENPVAGGVSQVTEVRAGHWDGARFVEHPGGSLIHDRAIISTAQETVMDGHEVRALRVSLNTLGDGFVEAIGNDTLQDIANSQPPFMRGQVIKVPVLEANGALRVARFGWKNQHASLVSFSADAYKNEMGITSPLEPTENTTNGRSVAEYDEVADPEDDGLDIEEFAKFMRATKVPPRDERAATSPAVQAGALVFNRIGCAICHTPTIITAPVGTVINGGAFEVPPALGDKIIHPFGDFLLHDIGTGDGIVQNGPASTRNKVRTAPLWGVRTRSRLMHDGESLSFQDAIQRHRGEAFGVRRAYQRLDDTERAQLIAFLRSL
jgi:CxxC motif-containing protein (DUF1111 family)